MFTELTNNLLMMLLMSGLSIVLCPTLCWILAAQVRNAYR